MPPTLDKLIHNGIETSWFGIVKRITYWKLADEYSLHPDYAPEIIDGYHRCYQEISRPVIVYTKSPFHRVIKALRWLWFDMLNTINSTYVVGLLPKGQRYLREHYL